jgi:hypothetical protein
MSGTATDEDDVAGRLDIARVRDRVVQIDDDRYRLTYRVQTYSPFGSERLAGPYRKFDLGLDRDGVRGAERNVLIESRSGVLRAVVTSTRSGRVIATLAASRPNDRVIALSGPRRTLGARNYLWTSYFHADNSGRCGWDGDVPRICQDSAPDKGWLRLQRLAWPGPR